MKKITIVVIAIILLIIENIGLWFLSSFYVQSYAYNKILEARRGVASACRNVEIADNLFSVLQKLDQYYPTIEAKSNRIYLSYGAEVLGGAGTALMFDKNYKLTYKGCDSDWEPSQDNGEVSVILNKSKR